MVISDEQLNRMVEEYLTHQRTIADAKRQQDFIKPLIKDYMNDRNEKKLHRDFYVITVSKQTRKNIDREKVKELLKDDFENVVTTKEIEMLKVMSKESYDNVNNMLREQKDGGK